MSISLANMTDAELGAMVRRSLGEAVVTKALEQVAEKEAEREAAAAERKRLAREDNNRRRSLITLPEFRLDSVTYAPLNVAAEAWDEVMPEIIARKYLNLINITFGTEFDVADEEDYEKVTWRVAYCLHAAWTISPTSRTNKLHAIMTARGIGEKAALETMRGIGNKGYEAFMRGVHSMA